ncbi:YdaU family protein [Roseomonas elaeocarpi]|uniref:YdaU family protein n=1 Tax=Roseomonas elaeocarpi TaxID=907779 RepID=A0ABV6JZ32_9PROT
MSKSDAWMPLYIGDYLADTMHLTAQEHGAYLLLLMHYWRNGPLPDDARMLSGIAKVERREWEREVGPVLRRFFTAEGGFLRQKRLDAERERANGVSGKRSKAADARWNKVREAKQEQSTSNANAPANASSVHMPGTSQSQSQSEEPSLRSGHAGGVPPLVEASAPVDARAYLWREGRAAFSRLTGKPEKQAGRMLGRWLQQAGDDCTVVTQVLADAEAHRPVDPIAWIEAAIAHRMGRRPGAQPEFRNGFLQNLADDRAAAAEGENPLLTNRFLPGGENRRAR